MVDTPEHPNERPTGGAPDGSDRPVLAVCYDTTSSSPMELIDAVGRLCDLVWVVDTADGSLGSMGRLLGRLGAVVDTAGRSGPEIAELLDRHGVHGVIAFADSQLARAADAAHRLGLPGNPPESIGRLNDKYLQRQALAAAGVDVPAHRLLPASTPVDEAIALLAGVRLPVVVKPRRGVNSREVRAVGDLTALGDRLHDGTGPDGLLIEDLIAEEYLPDRVDPGVQVIGGYVSVELMVRAGRPVPLALTGKFPLAQPFRETGNFMPHLLDEDEAGAVLDLSVEAATALGVRSGALHAEIKLTPDGPRVIEVNGRIGGGGIDGLFTRQHGRSLSELAALVALGREVDLVPEEAARWSGPFLYDYFVQPPVTAERIVSITGTDRIIGTSGAVAVAANRSPGDPLDWRLGSQGYLLHIQGRVADRAALRSVPAGLWGVLELDFG